MAGAGGGGKKPLREKKILKLNDWTCYSCGLDLVSRLRKIKGVTDVSVNFFTKQFLIEHEGADMKEIEEVINRAGMHITAERMK
jgi:copper chaperone CopZ